MKKRKHLFSVTRKDFEIQTFRSGGPGGQHQNTTDSGVRIIHKESGAVGISRNDRSQHRNKKLALERLTKSTKWKLWISRRVMEINEGITLEKQVEKSMTPENLRVEIKDEKGKWILE